ncbi:MAG: hypothetical protein H6659_17600 [Ardenticatenaceae bacterium]|nr:hypothetical protein [Ardenticatenaceae bacterium]
MLVGSGGVVGLGVAVGRGVRVAVGEAVGLAVTVGVWVSVGVTVGVVEGVMVGVDVDTAVDVGVGELKDTAVSPLPRHADKSKTAVRHKMTLLRDQYIVLPPKIKSAGDLRL